MKPVLVTGATGFLGRHLVRELVSRGVAVRALCRTKSDFPKSVEVVLGDVTSAADVKRAMDGTSQVYHLAGMVSRDPKDASRLRQVHVDGTRHVCDAASHLKIPRLVYASSSGTIAISRDPVMHTEDSPYKESIASRWPYYVTKIEAEKLAEQYPFVITLNPSLLLGPGDDRGSSTGDVKALLERQILSLPTGGLSFVDVRDCAVAAIAAMERGRPKQRYLLGSANWDFVQFSKAVSQASGVNVPFMKSPTWLSLLAAPVLRRVMPLLGRKFDIDDASIEMAGLFWYCDWSKATRELGFTPRDPMETIRDTVNDIRSRQPQ